MNILNSNFLKSICFSVVAVVLSGYSVRAQSIATIDLLSTLNELPPPPISVANAYSKADCIRGNCKADALFKTFDATLQNAEKQWGAMNAGQVAQVDSAKRIAGIMKPVAGSNVSATQKLEAAKQLAGGNTAAISFAQQMQDPAFKAKFNAMPQEQKLAYIQSNGVAAPPAPTQASDPPAPTPAGAALATISDTTYSQLKALGPSFANFLKTISDTNFDFSDSAFSQMQTSMLPKIDSMANILSAIISKADSNVTVLSAAHDKQLKSIIAAKKLNSISDQPAYHAIKMKSLTQEIADENTALQTFDTAYVSDKARLILIISKYNRSLITSHYAAGFTSPADEQLLTGIAQTQILAMGQLELYESILKHIYAEEANLASELKTVEAETVSPYQEH